MVRQDEFGELATSVNSLSDTLQSAISEINQEAHELESISSQLSDSCGTSQNVLEQQSDQGKSVSSAMQEMTHAVQEITESLTRTAGYSNDANVQTGEGIEAVSQNFDMMATLNGRITEASQLVSVLEEKCQSINSVIAVIGGIAEQTNLLALNASIEAARAGESGKGFSVVADEVRALSKRTAESTESVSDILVELNRKSEAASKIMKVCRQDVDVSREQAEKIGDLFGNISGLISEVDGMTSTIASAAEEQSVMSRDVADSAHKSKSLISTVWPPMTRSEARAPTCGRPVRHSSNCCKTLK